MLSTVVVDDVTGAPENRGGSEKDHRAREEKAKAEAHEEGEHDGDDGYEEADLDDPPEEGEILLGGEGNKGQSGEHGSCDHSGLSDQIRSIEESGAGRDEENGKKHDSLGYHEEAKTRILHSLAGRGQGPFVGQVGGQHESAEDEEHTVGTLCQNPHHLGVDVRNLEEGKLDQDEGPDGSGEVSIGPANKGGADVHGSGGHDVRVLVALKHDFGGKGSVVTGNIIPVHRERKKSGAVRRENCGRLARRIRLRS